MNKGKAITAVKALDKDFKCRGFQFVVGETYEHEGKVEICASGFHAHENPMDVWSYYDITDSRYALVELSGETDSKEGDTKRCAGKITITAELSLPDFIGRAVDWLIGVATEGNEVASGYSSQLAASGDSSKLAASGDYSKLAASGDSSQLAASGDSSKLAASGDSSQLAASGYSSKLAASGDYSVIASSGIKTKAKGADGTWISIAEFDDDYKCVGFAVGCIGKDGLKADTYYMAKNGKLEVAQ